jgi:hypothetical protein
MTRSVLAVQGCMCDASAPERRIVLSVEAPRLRVAEAEIREAGPACAGLLAQGRDVSSSQGSGSARVLFGSHERSDGTVASRVNCPA